MDKLNRTSHLMNCHWCAKEFVADHQEVKFCSGHCRRRARTAFANFGRTASSAIGKYCCRCGIDKPLSDFSAKQSWCKLCQKQYKALNKPTIKDQERLYAKTHAVQRRQAASAWAKLHPDRAKQLTVMAGHRRRARKRELPATFTDAQWQTALNYFNNRCAVCDRPQGLWHTIAQDHWIPIASPDCPGTIPTNIVPLCHAQKSGEGGCNNLKHNSNPHEWLTDRYGPRKAKQIEKRIATYFEWIITHLENPSRQEITNEAAK